MFVIWWWRRSIARVLIKSLIENIFFRVNMSGWMSDKICLDWYDIIYIEELKGREADALSSERWREVRWRNPWSWQRWCGKMACGDVITTDKDVDAISMPIDCKHSCQRLKYYLLNYLSFIIRISKSDVSNDHNQEASSKFNPTWQMSTLNWLRIILLL